ncbi:hypothetical protein MUN84_05140 [Hymenobacter sp. 5516J-16]|uniref:hypothetical protein n=1 Tax=Hymenobacter sp. 5516J-16 TaxID=2932253 RepID=UPI001FD183A2|nr:hypothetical protein [Hymenobacter sp. 5516J-16]UOQ78010.1 hypothetical protein MUN84_05140 [Hymenobacter sp. 5516J-16]
MRRIMLTTWLAGSATLLLLACQPQNDHPAESKTPATRAAVMRQHDDLMGRMDALTTERQRLTAQLAATDSATTTGYRRAQRLHRAIAALRRADAAMLTWMHQYQEPDTVQLTAHQYEDFWNTEAEELRALERHMTAALDSAKSVR